MHCMLQQTARVNIVKCLRYQSSYFCQSLSKYQSMRWWDQHFSFPVGRIILHKQAPLSHFWAIHRWWYHNVVITTSIHLVHLQSTKNRFDGFFEKHTSNSTLNPFCSTVTSLPSPNPLQALQVLVVCVLLSKAPSPEIATLWSNLIRPSELLHPIPNRAQYLYLSPINSDKKLGSISLVEGWMMGGVSPDAKLNHFVDRSFSRHSTMAEGSNFAESWWKCTDSTPIYLPNEL